VIPFSVIVSFIDSIMPGRIYAWRSTIGCKGAATEEKAENMLTMKMKRRKVGLNSVSKKKTILLTYVCLWLRILLGKKEVNCECCKTIERKLPEPKGVSHKDWRIFYDTCNTDADKSELLGSSKCRRLLIRHDVSVRYNVKWSSKSLIVPEVFELFGQYYQRPN